MKKLYSTLITCALGASSLFAQSWQTIGSGFLNSGDIASNLQVLSYQDTAFVAYADMDVVKLKKRSGNNWSTVVNQNTEKNYFKLIYGTDDKPYLITLSRSASIVSVGSTGFFADIHEYDNGALTLIESREMMFVPSGTNMTLDVSNFDFTMRPNGDMAGIIRYPSSARSVYNVKIGNNPWFAENVFYEAIGGSAGNAIEQSNITFFDEGVMILSRLSGQSAGSAHLFFHDNTTSTPTSSILNDGSFGVATSAVNPMSVASRADTVYMAYTNNSNQQQFRKFYNDPSAAEPLATIFMQTYAGEILGTKIALTPTNNYIIYVEENNTTFEMEGFVSDLTANYSITDGQVVGATPFSLGEQVIGPEVMSVDPSTGEIYVAYIHGPPMTQSIVRKLGCASVTAAYNTTDNELSVSSSYSTSASFKWVKCGETTVLSTDDTFEPTEDGDYQATVTDGACEETSNCVTVVIEEDDDDSANLSFNEFNALVIYPNPSSGQVNISGKNLLGSTLSVHDLTGKEVFVGALNSNANLINLTGLEKGIYLFNITSEVKNLTRKVLIK